MKTKLTLMLLMMAAAHLPAKSQNFNMTGIFSGGIFFEEKDHCAFRLLWNVVATGNKFSGTAEILGFNCKGFMTTEIEGTIEGNKITFVEKKVLKLDKKPAFDRGFTKKRGVLYIENLGDSFYISGKAFSQIFKDQKITINFPSLPHNFAADSAKNMQKNTDKSDYLKAADIDKKEGENVSGKKIKFDNLIFDFNSTNLKNSELLDPLATFLAKNPKISITVEGHTDNKGEHAYNKQLSEKRAKTVGDYLIDKGINAERIKIHGFGNEKNISEKDEENRRVEIIFSKKN